MHNHLNPSMSNSSKGVNWVSIPMQGSIEHAACQLENYRALLEKEVITSFDKAVHQKDLGTMAECAQVMTEFERGDSALMQVCQCNTLTT